MPRQIGLVYLILIFATLTACGLAPSLVELPPPTLSSTDYTSYRVQSGDTLSQIAARFNVTIEQLIALNSAQYPSLAKDPSQIRVGWQLRVPNASIGARGTATAASEFPNVDLSLAAKLMLEGINTARAQRNLVLLRSDLVLTRIAADRSSDMIARDYFSHYDPQSGQEALLKNLQAAGFSYQYAGENIAEIKNDAGWVPPMLTVAARYRPADLASEFDKGWLNSPEHLANILNSHYRRTGIALAVSRDGRRITATQVFSD